MRAPHSPDESAPLLDEPSNVLEVIWNKASSGVPPADELPPDADGLPPLSDELDFLTPDDFRTLPALPLLLTTSDPELSRVFCLCWSRGLPPDVVTATTAAYRQDTTDERRSGSVSLMVMMVQVMMEIRMLVRMEA
jgi:hypothetical protein